MGNMMMMMMQYMRNELGSTSLRCRPSKHVFQEQQHNSAKHQPDKMQRERTQNKTTKQSCLYCWLTTGWQCSMRG
jgi:hypothetical protein